MNTDKHGSRMIPQIKGVVPIEQMRGDGVEDTKLLRSMFAVAKRWLESFDWCGGIRKSYFGLGIGGVVAAFLFRIKPAKPEVDEWLWVIVGDLPPAYIVAIENPTPVEALKGYIYEMRRWALATRRGKRVDQRIPVDVPATPGWARKLNTRLDFIENEILPMYVAAQETPLPRKRGQSRSLAPMNRRSG